MRQAVLVRWPLAAGLWLVLAAAACTHRVEVATPEPLTINLNIKLELADEVTALLAEERAATGAKTRALKPADPAEQLKAAGLAGEDLRGYLAVPGAGALEPAQAERLAQVNAERRSAYQQIASAKQQPLAAVETVAGELRISQEPSGRLVMAADGRFAAKP